MNHPYSSRSYVEALAGADRAVHFPEVGTWATIKNIPGSDRVNVAGPYPFANIERPQSMESVRRSLSAIGAVSFVAVTDALRDNSDWLEDEFDWVRQYKTHYVLDRDLPPPVLSNERRYKIGKANRACETRLVSLGDHLDEWRALYDNLIERHGLHGIHRFSHSYFAALAAMPDFVAVAAFAARELVSCHLWLVHGDFAYSHLSATSQEGYRLRAASAVYVKSLSLLQGCRIVDLGGAADNARSAGGLAEFKKGFSNDTRTNRVCGVVSDPDAYASICVEAGVDPDSTSYFPAYRTAAPLSPRPFAGPVAGCRP